MSEFCEFKVIRDGWRWIVVKHDSDGITRNTHAIRSWRWITAARVASALMQQERAGFRRGRAE